VGCETRFPREVAEAAFAHPVGDETYHAYQRNDALMKRGQLMGQWADFLAGEAAPKVVKLRPGRRA